MNQRIESEMSFWNLAMMSNELRDGDNEVDGILRFIRTFKKRIRDYNQILFNWWFTAKLFESFSEKIHQISKIFKVFEFFSINFEVFSKFELNLINIELFKTL